MNTNELAELHDFIRRYRQATLATVDGGVPHTAMVSYAEEPSRSGQTKSDQPLAGMTLLIHLSDLGSHKRHLRADPRCSLLIAEPDSGRGEVLSLSRVALQGVASLIPKGTIEYDDARQRYLAKLPTSAMMFALADFDLFRIHVTGGRFIAGFGRALTV